MTCRWVTASRFTTFGRRLVITSAVFGLTTVGSAGVALAASEPVGVSPAAPVVARAPMAVSVTFGESLSAGGARIRVLTSDGDVGTGRISTSRKTLRRALRLGAPAGEYVVEWNAVSAKGRKMSGRFTFTAARSNGEIERTSPVPSPPTSGPEPTSAAEPTSVPVPSPARTPEWLAETGPLWTPQPTPELTVAAEPGSGSGRSGGTSDVSSGFTAVPLTVGGLLVLAAGIVSLVNRPRLRG